jgi:hypothetical protein
MNNLDLTLNFRGRDCMHKLAMLIYGVLRSGQPFDVDFEKKKLAFQDGIWPSFSSLPEDHSMLTQRLTRGESIRKN